MRTRQLTFRLPEELIARVDECAQRIQTESALPVTRTDVVRMLLTHALDQSPDRIAILLGNRRERSRRR